MRPAQDMGWADEAPFLEVVLVEVAAVLAFEVVPAAAVVAAAAVVPSAVVMGVVTAATVDDPAVVEPAADDDPAAVELAAADDDPAAEVAPTQAVLPARIVKIPEGFVRPRESRMTSVTDVPTASWGVQVMASALVVPMLSSGVAPAWPPGTAVMMNGGEDPEKVS